MRKPLKDKETLLKDLAGVFRTYGYTGATLTEFTKATGLERASLYHYFPGGKADMAKEVLQSTLKELSTKVLSSLKNKKSPHIRIKDMLEEVDKFYDGGNHMCYITLFATAPEDTDLVNIISMAVNTWLNELSKTLKEMERKNPQSEALLILSAIQGALIIGHVMQRKKVFRTVMEVLK